MTITAKFASRCAACGHAIAPGAQIEWTKGESARHTSCASARVAAPSSPAAYGAPTGGRRSRVDHEDCLSLGPCGPHCEYAFILGGGR